MFVILDVSQRKYDDHVRDFRPLDVSHRKYDDHVRDFIDVLS